MLIVLVTGNVVLLLAAIALGQSVALDVKPYMPVVYQQNAEYMRVIHRFIYEDYVPYPLQNRYFLATNIGAVALIGPFLESLAWWWPKGILFFLVPALGGAWTLWYNFRHCKRRPPAKPDNAA